MKERRRRLKRETKEYAIGVGLSLCSLNGNGAPNNASSQTKNYEIIPFIHSGLTEGSYHSSLFFMLSQRSGESCNQ
ncbi:hypothetical protein BVRB_6g140550 [Beta vulgaris subsp. vulgaris]|nr:hypothetical protein BVRB_6g140550 [Beta vulgaris subsp. vulgaris]